MHQAVSAVIKKPRELLNKSVVNLLLMTVLLAMFVGIISGYRLVFGLLLIIGFSAIILLRFPKAAVFFIAIYFPFEEIILKFLPVSDSVYSYLRFSGELLIYSLFLAVIVRKVWKRSFKATPLDIPLLLFVGVSLVSALVNYTSLMEVALFLRAILRYVFLFYAVANLEFSDKFIRRLIITLIIIGLIQVSIGAAQVTIGAPVNKLLTPRVSDMTVSGYSKNFNILSNREIGSMYGTTGDTINLALFLMITLVLSATLAFYSEKTRRIWLMIISTIFIAGIAYTFSRGTLISASIILTIILLARRKKILFVSLCAVIFLVLSFIPIQKTNSASYKGSNQARQSPLTDFSHIFTKRYKKAADQGRLFILNTVTNDVLSNRPLTGFGPTYGEKARYSLIRDVYWVNILYKIGILGLITFVFIFFKLGYTVYKLSSNRQSQYTRLIAQVFLLIMVGIAVQNFIIPVSEIRISSIYFWLFAGLMVSRMLNYVKKDGKKNKTIVQKVEVSEVQQIGEVQKI